jgi:hypothetical protein
VGVAREIGEAGRSAIWVASDLLHADLPAPGEAQKPGDDGAGSPPQAL